ncbi:MAG: DUF1343 domain-containing protein [Bacteroidales bacterium]|nr:DUF1343 domain-containing protein [Bacteroidales bacterium]
MTFIILVSSCCSDPQGKETDVTPGAYQTREYIPYLSNKRIGVVVNQTSMIENVHLVDTLISSGINVVKIFSPEHGFKGDKSDGEIIEDENSEEYNIPVISLYGNDKMLNAHDVRDIDIMVFDIQDVGVRFYTYISTLHYVLEGCAQNNIPVLVLDRPNPNRQYIDGPVLKKEFSSFIGMHPVPVVYGMTIGEYAGMINGELWLKDSLQCKLEIVKCENYDHSSYYDLPVNPSPNLRNITAIYLYPSLAFFEGTVVSVGRGTKFPFLVIGHPDYTDTTFSFIPQSDPEASLHPKLKGQKCYGINLQGINADSLRCNGRIELSYLISFYNDLNLGDEFFTDYFTLLAGNNELSNQIIEGKTAEEIKESWQKDLEKYKIIRAKYLLYPDF